jgi:hypothetical protein
MLDRVINRHGDLQERVARKLHCKLRYELLQVDSPWVLGPIDSVSNTHGPVLLRLDVFQVLFDAPATAGDLAEALEREVDGACVQGGLGTEDGGGGGGYGVAERGRRVEEGGRGVCHFVIGE